MIMNHKRTSIIEKGLMYFVKGNINELMFKSGYGIVAYISKHNTMLLLQMRESEKEAKVSKAGVWSIKVVVEK